MFKRNYRREERMQGLEKRKRERAARNRARYAYLKKLTAKYGATRAREMMEGKDVDHIKSLAEGGSNKPSNLALRSAHQNRGDKDIFEGRRTTRPKHHRGSQG
jgi:hypothetical protein